MKKRTLGGIALLGAVTALSASLLVVAPKAAESKALAPWNINETSYEVAFMEQYCGGEEYGYTNDKPIYEKNALGGHIYGEGEGSSRKNYTHNLQSGINEEFEWTFTKIRAQNYYNREGKPTSDLAYIQLETSDDTNALDTDIYAADSDENKIALLTKGSSTNVNKVAVMKSADYFDVVNDITFYWRTSYATKLALCYQLEGGDWVRLWSTTSGVGNIDGSGWQDNGWSTFNLGSAWTEGPLHGHKAKLAFAITDAVSEDGNWPISGLCINADFAAVKYLNALTYRDGVCAANKSETSQYDLNKDDRDHVHNQDLFRLATENADANVLLQYEIERPKTSETTILGFYNYLVSAIPSLGAQKVPSARFVSGSSTANVNVYVAIAVVSSVSVAAVTTLLIIKKKKHN